MNWLLLSGFVLILASFCKCQTNCPEPEEILPCTCIASPKPILTCENVVELDMLKNAFYNSAGRNFYQVIIKNSVLNYIPAEIFSDVDIEQLYIEKVTLSQIFDFPPTQLKTLKFMELYDTKVLRGVLWEILEPMVELESLSIIKVDVKILKEDFSRYATDKLKSLTFHKTKITSIKPGVFQKFTNLRAFVMQIGSIEEIRRDLFPIPFNSITLFSFESQKLKSLPDGMFSDMPNLSSLSLNGNMLTELHSSQFGGSMERLNQLLIQFNPIRCDCKLKWLIENPPKSIYGYCDSPQRLKDKSLSELTVNDLNC